jgi:hypothetical protein
MGTGLSFLIDNTDRFTRNIDRFTVSNRFSLFQI